jgi:hypothetical protein
VSFDGRIAVFKKVFKPLAGFNPLQFLAEVLAQTGGDRPDLAATRQAIAGAMPLYGPLASPAPTTYLCDEAVRHPRARRFAMAPASPAPVGQGYASATTFSRVAEAAVRAKLAENPAAALCETR